MEHVHKHHMAHRDLKLENIILAEEKNEDGEAKEVDWSSPNELNILVNVCDFGLGRGNPKSKLSDAMVGTPKYMAP